MGGRVADAGCTCHPLFYWSGTWHTFRPPKGRKYKLQVVFDQRVAYVVIGSRRRYQPVANDNAPGDAELRGPFGVRKLALHGRFTPAKRLQSSLTLDGARSRADAIWGTGT
jgi:hypothetical protein